MFATLATAVVPIGFASVFVIWPLVAIGSRAFAAEGLGLQPFVEVWSSSRSRSIIGFTFVQAAWSTIATFVVGVPAAWSVSRGWFGRSATRIATAAAFVLPTVVMGLAWRGLVDRGLPAIVLAHVSFNAAVVVQILGVAWAGLDPLPGEAARTLGASPARVWRSVTAPRLAAPAATAALLTFLFSFTSFGVVVVLGTGRQGTIETEIARAARGLDFERAGALAALQLLVVLCALSIAGRAGRVTSTDAPGALRAHRRSWVAMVAAVPALGVVLIPIMSLVVRVLAPQGSLSMEGIEILTANDLRIDGSPLDSIVTSLRMAAIAVSVAMVVGGLVIAGSVRGRADPQTRLRRVLEAVLMVPLGVSAVTLGYGYLITFDEAPLRLRDYWWIVPLAHAAVAMPFVVRVLAPARRALDARVIEVARTLGASGRVVTSTVTLPLLLPAIGVAFGFAAAISIGEFGATSMLARQGSPTAPFAIGQLAGVPGERGRLASDSLALLLAAMTLTIMACAQRPTRRLSR